jgi:hypothetical protein
MLECECLATCPFFNDKMKEKPAMAKVYKEKYCLGGHKTECARYSVRNAIGKENVPLDLYPNQMDTANIIIANFKR